MSPRSCSTLAAVVSVLIGTSRSAAVPPTPLPVIDDCRCSATTFQRNADGSLSPRTSTTFVTDVDDGSGGAPRDTCAASARIDIDWHADPHGAVGYRYRLDESSFIEVGPNVTSVTYESGDSGLVTPGTKVFTLGARGPKSAYQDISRRFEWDYVPDTWWSGPDPNSLSLRIKPNGERYALLVGGELPAAGIAGSLLGPDSTLVMPALRRERNTFFEIWKDTVYVRQDGDTVHMNSWIVLHNGGFDRDSRYAVKVTDLGRQLPGFPGGPVLEPGPANGSPVGFRFALAVALTPNSLRSFGPVSGLYPNFDPEDVFYQPRIAGFRPVFFAGRAFAWAQAQDGDGARDDRVRDGLDLVRRVEDGTATAAEVALRSKVLTFFVDRAPYFVTTNPLFRPAASDTFRTAQWELRLIGNDDDPFQPGTPAGGPSAVTTLRRTIKVLGKDSQGTDFTYIDPTAYVNQSDITITVPAALAPGRCTVEVQLCDCELCENLPGSGRCVTQLFPVIYESSGSSSIAANAAARAASQTLAGRAPTVLFAPYPNPSSRVVTIHFNLASAGDAALELFDLGGSRVRRLASGAFSAGEHSQVWNRADDDGRPVTAGVYFVRLRTAEASWTKKLFVAP